MSEAGLSLLPLSALGRSLRVGWLRRKVQCASLGPHRASTSPFYKEGWSGSPRRRGSARRVRALGSGWPHVDRAAVFTLHLRGGNRHPEKRSHQTGPDKGSTAPTSRD